MEKYTYLDDKKCLIPNKNNKKPETPRHLPENFTLKDSTKKPNIKKLFLYLKKEKKAEKENFIKNTKTELDSLQIKIYDNIDNQKLLKLKVWERLKIIEKYLNSSEIKIYFNIFLKQLENKSVILKIDWTNKTKKIVFSKKFIEDNKEKILNNFKKLLLMIIHIESDGNPLAKNKKGSSAIWLWQWLVWNWKYEIEYFYKGKWYFWKNLKWKWIILSKLKKRKIWLTSSWETKINNIWRYYPEKISEYIRWFPDKNITKTFKIKPFDISWQEQIKILILWSFSKNKKNNQILLASLLWNQWWLKKFYKLYHTNPKSDTITRINDISPKYINQLKKYNLKNNYFN